MQAVEDLVAHPSRKSERKQAAAGHVDLCESKTSEAVLANLQQAVSELNIELDCSLEGSVVAIITSIVRLASAV